MNQRDQKQRRRGAVDRINTGIDTIRKAQTAIKIARTAGTAAETIATSGVWGPVAIIVGVILLIIIFVVIIIVATTGGGTGSANPLPGGGSPGSGNISSCIFYRGGDTTQGLSFGNPQMAALVSDISTQIGVPPAIVAGIMRVESASALAQTDPSYLINDYDDTISSSGVAYGIMQFTPDTFITTFNNNSSEMNTLFGKNRLRTVIDSRDSAYPINYLRIYSIKDSIIATAFKIKNDKQSINRDGPWDQSTVHEIAWRYYGCLRYGPGGCTSGPYNYGEDVWKSYTNCQVPILAEGSCPIPNGVVTCGSKNKPVNGCGHCGLGYPRPDLCTYDGINYAMDIAGDNDELTFDPVYLPKVNGNVIKWTFISQDRGAEAIQRYTGVDELTHEQYFISLHHTQFDSGNPGTHFSGEVGAKICGGGCNEGHVHVEFGTGSTGNYRDAPDYFCRR